MREFILPIALWLENQVDVNFEQDLPIWAGQLDNAHNNNHICVLAHEDSAYAKAGLACHVLTGSLWPDGSVMDQLTQCVTSALSAGAKKVIIILPPRASSSLWGQWLLCDLPETNAQLDELLVLMPLDVEWGNFSQGLIADKLLLADRVLAYRCDDQQAKLFAEKMCSLNPLAVWIRNGFVEEEDILYPVNAYGIEAPLWRVPLKKEDLLAWGAHKVVYLSFDQPLSNIKLKAMLDLWRVKYGSNLTRLQAVIQLKGESSPLIVQALQHLWTEGFLEQWPPERSPETQIWIQGQGLPWAELEADVKNCIAV